MKLGKKDIPIKIKICGTKLYELQKYTYQMCEAFGLDRKIENYKGTRPITLYSWDLDCLIDILSMVLRDEKEYPDKNTDEYIELNNLYIDLKDLNTKTYKSKQK
jgi:hypothetical protein